jgi:hypothetical protein
MDETLAVPAAGLSVAEEVAVNDVAVGLRAKNLCLASEH